jgi:hypothetical protein
MGLNILNNQKRRNKMDETLQAIYAGKCKYAMKLHNLGFAQKKVDSYFIKEISSGKVVLDLGNNLEFHYSPWHFIKWWVQ